MINWNVVIICVTLLLCATSAIGTWSKVRMAHLELHKTQLDALKANVDSAEAVRAAWRSN